MIFFTDSDLFFIIVNYLEKAVWYLELLVKVKNTSSTCVHGICKLETYHKLSLKDNSSPSTKAVELRLASTCIGISGDSSVKLI